MNKKPTILAVAALGSLALIGTGFAGWVIVANATSTASGNITAYEVTDNRLTATGKWAGDRAADSGSIVFGKPSGASDTSSTWFKSKDVGEEKLSDTYTLSIASKNDKDTAKVKVSAILNITEKDSTNPYKAALDNHWIAGPTLTYSGTDLFKKDSSGGVPNSVELTLVAGEVSAEFTFGFAWGSHFGGENPQNPFTYYNNKEAGSTIDAATSETYGDDAAKVMGALGKINQTKFSITFTIERAA